jgi:hypothetical protein
VTLLSDVDGTSASTSPHCWLGRVRSERRAPWRRAKTSPAGPGAPVCAPGPPAFSFATPAWRAAPAASHRPPALRRRARSRGILRRERPCARCLLSGRRYTTLDDPSVVSTFAFGITARGFCGAAAGLVARMRSDHCALRSDRPKHPRAASRASVSSDRRTSPHSVHLGRLAGDRLPLIRDGSRTCRRAEVGTIVAEARG